LASNPYWCIRQPPAAAHIGQLASQPAGLLGSEEYDYICNLLRKTDPV
jgi:hypothetical protein